MLRITIRHIFLYLHYFILSNPRVLSLLVFFLSYFAIFFQYLEYKRKLVFLVDTKEALELIHEYSNSFTLKRIQCQLIKSEERKKTHQHLKRMIFAIKKKNKGQILPLYQVVKLDEKYFSTEKHNILSDSFELQNKS